MERGQVQLLSERDPVPMFLKLAGDVPTGPSLRQTEWHYVKKSISFRNSPTDTRGLFHAIALNGPPPLNKLIREIRGFAYS